MKNKPLIPVNLDFWSLLEELASGVALLRNDNEDSPGFAAEFLVHWWESF